VIGFGWINGKKVASNYRKTGYVIKNLGLRKSVFSTAWYQLSHCGIRKRRHTVVWVGLLAYNKLKIPILPSVSDICPICGLPLNSIKYDGETNPLEKMPKGGFFEDPDGWKYKK